MPDGMKFGCVCSRARLEKIAVLLEDGPLTVPKVAASVYCSERTAYVYLAELARRGTVRVSAWVPQPRGGAPGRVFDLGPAPDAPRPKREPRKDRGRFADPEVLMRKLALRRATRIRPRRDPMTAAMFGPPP